MTLSSSLYENFAIDTINIPWQHLSAPPDKYLASSASAALSAKC